MKPVKTHTFKGRKYYVDIADIIEGVCDLPTKSGDKMWITVLEGDDFRALHSAFEECLHALRIPDKYLHNADGTSKVIDGSRFLWRMGYRRAE